MLLLQVLRTQTLTQLYGGGRFSPIMMVYNLKFSTLMSNTIYNKLCP